MNQLYPEKNPKPQGANGRAQEKETNPRDEHENEQVQGNCTCTPCHCIHVKRHEYTRTRSFLGRNDDYAGKGRTNEDVAAMTTMKVDSHGPLYAHNWTLGYVLLVAINIVCTLSCLCHMHATHGTPSNNRVPPSWAPTMEPGYMFTMWQRDILLWTVANSDLEPHRQAALVLQQLRGGARELTRDLPVNVIMNGALLNGIQVDAATYIMNVLAERYGQLDEELRLK